MSVGIGATRGEVESNTSHVPGVSVHGGGALLARYPGLSQLLTPPTLGGWRGSV